jgi:hypothetical protein
MTFEEILDHAIAMLQRRRRVAYRTLQVQFNLDENALEALRDELLYAQQVARDEDGRDLIASSILCPAGLPASDGRRTNRPVCAFSKRTSPLRGRAPSAYGAVL